MQAYRTKAEVGGDGRVSVVGVPFPEGERVEVIILQAAESEPKHQVQYPLRGVAVRFDDPFGSVADDDWEALK